MKKFVLLLLSLLTLSGCGVDNETTRPEGYDYIVGTDYSDLVTITFKYGNIDDKVINAKIGDVYKVWGIPRNTSLGYDLEPKPPFHIYLSAWTMYGFSQNFTAENDITLHSYVFTKDTVLFVKYYESLMETRFCIPNGPTNKGSGMMFSQKSFLGNQEIYRMPSLNNLTFDTDWGSTKLAYDISPWITQWGWTKLDGWYYDEEFTREITLPFRVTHNGADLKWWIKCS